MLPKISLLLAISALLGPTALALPAHEVPNPLALRQTACPTVSSWKAYSWSTVILSTYTVTNRYSSLGSVTSTKTESRTLTLGTVSTVISPAVTTIPSEPNRSSWLQKTNVCAATTATAIVAVETSTLVWDTITERVTSPGYAPASECDVTTVTHIIPSTSSYTWTQAVSYVGLLRFILPSRGCQGTVGTDGFLEQVRHNVDKHDGPCQHNNRGLL